MEDERTSKRRCLPAVPRSEGADGQEVTVNTNTGVAQPHTDERESQGLVSLRGATMSHSVAAPSHMQGESEIVTHRNRDLAEVGMKPILNANIFNMHGLEDVNVAELKNIQTETKCNANFMVETWNGPQKPNINSVVGKLSDEFQVQGWNLVGVECACIPYAFVGAHGEVVLSHPDLNCISCHEVATALPDLNHRMLATRFSSGGYKFRAIICHLKAGSGVQTEANKHLQVLAAMQYFDEAEEEEILIFAGDMNTHVQSGFWSQLAEPFYENGFTCPSKTQIYDIDPVNSWTHIPTMAGANRNMLEHIFIKNPFNLPVEVKLLDIKLTSDHPRFLNLKIYGPDHPPIEIASPAPIEDHFKFKCPECRKGYATERSLKTYHEVCPCFSIDEAIATANNTGKVTTDSEMFLCEECPYESKSLQIVTTHAKVHIDDPYNTRPIKCNHCSARYTRQVDLTKHLKVHKINREPLKCEDNNCPYECDNPSAMLQHKLLVHTGDDKPNKCTICSASYSQRSGLAMHMHLHGIDITTDLYKCSHCNYSAQSSFGVERHNSVHIDSREFKCTFCNATFDCKQHLADHARYH